MNKRTDTPQPCPCCGTPMDEPNPDAANSYASFLCWDAERLLKVIEDGGELHPHDRKDLERALQTLEVVFWKEGRTA